MAGHYRKCYCYHTQSREYLLGESSISSAELSENLLYASITMAASTLIVGGGIVM